MSFEWAQDPSFQRSLPARRLPIRRGPAGGSRIGLLARFAGDRHITGTPFDARFDAPVDDLTAAR